MQFSDTSTKTGIVQKIEHYLNKNYGDITGNTNDLYKITTFCNTALHCIWFWIFDSYGGWIYDDNNNTDLPVATTNLVSGQDSYTLPATALSIVRVECVDENGDFKLLDEVDLEEIDNKSEEDFAGQDGNPTRYRLIGNTITIYPASDFNYTSGLKVYFERAMSEFTYNDTTKSPGFAFPFHNAVAVGAALEWIKIKPGSNKDSITLLNNDWLGYEQKIREYYGRRFRDKKPTISIKKKCLR